MTTEEKLFTAFAMYKFRHDGRAWREEGDSYAANKAKDAVRAFDRAKERHKELAEISVSHNLPEQKEVYFGDLLD